MGACFVRMQSLSFGTALQGSITACHVPRFWSPNATSPRRSMLARASSGNWMGPASVRGASWFVERARTESCELLARSFPQVFLQTYPSLVPLEIPTPAPEICSLPVRSSCGGEAVRAADLRLQTAQAEVHHQAQGGAGVASQAGCVERLCLRTRPR